MEGTEAWLVVGLGNPGPAYAGHRHNVGYLVVDELVRRQGSPLRAHKSGRAEVLEGRFAPPGVEGPRVVLVRPRTYMNEIGGPVKALAGFYGVPPERIVAIHDELDIPFETMRVKLGGGRQRAQRAARRCGRRSAPVTSTGCGSASAARRAVRTRRTSCCPTTRRPSARCCRSRSTGPRTPSSRWSPQGLERTQQQFNS